LFPKLQIIAFKKKNKILIQ